MGILIAGSVVALTLGFGPVVSSARADDAGVARTLGIDGGCVTGIREPVCEAYSGASGAGENCRMEYWVRDPGRILLREASVGEGTEALPAQILHEGGGSVMEAIGAIIVNEFADKVRQTKAFVAWPYNAIRARQRIGLVRDELEAHRCS